MNTVKYWFIISAMNKIISCIICLLLVAFSSTTKADEFNVVFINPGHINGDSTGRFWSDVSRFMSAAADDLNINLTSVYANRDHILMKQLAASVHKQRPDAVIIVNEKGIGVALVKELAKHDLPVFVLLNGFSQRELAKFNQEQKNSLIGSVIANNYQAGKRLMQDLYQSHKLKAPSRNNYELLMLRGDYNSPAAIDRAQGAKDFVAEVQELRVFDNPVANWSKEQAYKKVKGILLRRSPDIIWAANDPMAFGASLAVKEANLSDKVTIGGFNWDSAKHEPSIDMSYGGHVILGAKALVMLSDHKNGHLPSCQMHLVEDIFSRNQDNNEQKFRANTAGDKLAQFDFSKFSYANPEPAAFTLSTFIDKRYQVVANTTECKD